MKKKKLKVYDNNSFPAKNIYFEALFSKVNENNAQLLKRKLFFLI